MCVGGDILQVLDHPTPAHPTNKIISSLTDEELKYVFD